MAKSGFATGFAGFLIGVVTGLGVAAGAMLVISKSPVPFVDKVDKVTADVDPAAKLAGGVDPNARLNRSASEHQGEGAGELGTVKKVTVADKQPDDAAEAPARDAAGKAVQPGRITPVTYWVQVGAFSKRADAETNAATLAMQGIGAQVQEGNDVWRVRVGPFETKAEAREALDSLADQGMKPAIVEQK